MSKALFMSFIIGLLCQQVRANSEVEDAKRSLQALLKPILQQQSKKAGKNLLNNFSVHNCERYKINWMDLLTLKDSVALTYKFKPGCDIEGIIRPAIIRPFPADLKLKNLHDFSRLESENKITTTLESKPVLNLAVRSATLTGKKGKVLFEADYSVRINPLKKTAPVEENIGGEIRLTEIYGKKVSIKEKIFIK